MKIEIIKPVNHELQKHIECFYILTHSNNNKTTYLTFPSIFSIVSIIENVELNRDDQIIKVHESKHKNFISDIESRFSKPLLIEYQGNIKEITTYFKPFGLNHFLDQPLSHYCDKENNEFIPFSDYTDTMQIILKIKSKEETAKKLETYWLNKLKADSYFKIENIVKDIIDNPNLSISSIASNNNISHKTLIAHFEKYLCKTPSEFKKIVRFRKSLEQKEKNSLTQLTYLSNYFDQAHMHRDFKNLTGYNPKDFFKNLSSFQDKINWIFTSM